MVMVMEEMCRELEDYDDIQCQSELERCESIESSRDTV